MMKKMWKKNTKAVSPVIATILMVAITVVLAAVLYVMVMGFGGDGGSTPSGSFTAVQKIDNKEKVIFGQITPDTNITELKIVVTNSSSDSSTTSTFTTNDGKSFDESPQTDIGLSYVDLAKDGKISVGDYLEITGCQTGHTYTVSMIFTETGDLIDDISFTY